MVIVTVSVNVRCCSFNIQSKSHGTLSQRRQFRFQRCPSWNLLLSLKNPKPTVLFTGLGLSLCSCCKTTYSILRNNDGEAWHSTRVHVPSTVYRIRQTSHLCYTTRVTRLKTMRMSMTPAVTNRSK